MGRRLTLVVPSLALGGAERVVARMANHWAARGDTVTVITLSVTATDTYPLDPPVTRVALDLMRESRGPVGAFVNNWIRVRRLREAIRQSQPDTRDQFYRSHEHRDTAGVPATRRRYSRLRADRSVAATSRPHMVVASAACLPPVSGSRRANGNGTPADGTSDAQPADLCDSECRRRAGQCREPRQSTDRCLQLAAMGRLAPQKGFDLLIDAFARAAQDKPDWSLSILGEGPERRRLEEQIHKRGLEGRVRLCGWVSDPATVLRNCDAFVLSSRFEGFPNALLEAMALGLPAIAADCPSGPAEIIRHEVDGLLVAARDVPALSAAIRRLLSDDQLRGRLGAEAAHVVDRFSSERYFALGHRPAQRAASERRLTGRMTLATCSRGSGNLANGMSGISASEAPVRGRQIVAQGVSPGSRAAVFGV